MKKILAIILIFSALLGLSSCAKYKPVKSTKEESKIVMKLYFGDEEYEVKYELYRALFLNYKSEVDGGNPEVWSGPEKQLYVNRINSLIIRDVSNIFAAFYICDKGIGYNVYSGKADKLVDSYIQESIEGSANSLGFTSYDEYLSYLKSINHNYSTQDLLYRYYIALDKINEYYAGGTADSYTGEGEIAEAHLDTSVDKVRKFYYSADFKRVLYAYFDKRVEQEKLNSFYSQIKSAAEAGNTEKIKELISTSSATAPTDAMHGLFVPKYSYNNDMLEKLGTDIFNLSAGQLSSVITLSGGREASLNGLYIFYNTEKSEEDFERYYEQVRQAYINNFLGEFLGAHAGTMARSAKYTSEYSGINHANISM